MELDENGVEISPADTVPKPPQDVISVDSSATRSSPGNEGGIDAGVDTGVLVTKSVMDSGGMQGGIIGCTSNDNVNNSTKSLPVPVLNGDCRDAYNHSDDAMSTNDAEIEANLLLC